MVNMEELHRELMISQKNDELTQMANDMLIDLSNKVLEEISIKYSKFEKGELLKAGSDDIFKYWKNFNGEKFKNPIPYFEELFKRGIARFYNLNTKEYKEKKFLDSLNSLGRKILKFDLPYEIELDGSTIRKFSYVDKENV